MKEFWKKFASVTIQHKKGIHISAVGMMSIMVVFLTAYMLMVPGTTAEKESKEHRHDASCYEESRELICTQKEQESHHHEPTCYEKQKGALQCTIEEHDHTEECYVWEDVLICEKEESEGHIHTEECYKNNQTLICEQPEKLEVKEDSHVENSVPLDLEKEDLIKSFLLQYKDKTSNSWVEITNETMDIPGDATVLLSINYHKLDIQELKDAGYQVAYGLPALLKEPVASGELKGDGQTIGRIEVDGRKIILTFSQEWISQLEANGNHEISGEFHVESQFDGSQIEGDGPGTISIGGLQVQVHFENEVSAKHGRVTVNKNAPSLEEKEDGLYLTYSIQVSVPKGAADVPDVKVVDRFAENSKYVKAYLGVDGTAKETQEETKNANLEKGPIEKLQAGKGRGQVYLGNASSLEQPIPDPAGESLVQPGILVWNIGTMKAEETRTLTYQVKLKENYKAVNVNGNNQKIQNVAEVYAKTYLRGDSQSQFAPNISVDIVKKVKKFVPNEGDDGGKLFYEILVSAPNSNSYTVHNVKVADSFSTEKFTPYLDYEKESFRVYKGKETTGSPVPLDTLRPNNVAENPKIKAESSSQKGFDLYIGDLEPGSAKTITYTVLVKPGIYVVDNGRITIGNTAGAYSDDKYEGGNKKYKDSHAESVIGEKNWSRKVIGTFSKEEKTISIPHNDKVYVKNGGRFEEESPKAETFQVPKFSQEYQVLVNEEGQWDFSEVEFKDTLKQEQMVHTGYVKIEAYQVGTPGGGRTNETSDSEAIATVKKGTLQQTVWLNIDQQRSFAFQPKDLQLQGPCAYLLTYYSTLKDPDSSYHIHVDNEFLLTGKVVGPNGSKVTIPGITVEQAVEVQGTNHYSTEKIAWYYEKPSEQPSSKWGKGALYWAIKIEGSSIPKKFKLKDTVQKDWHKMIENESLVGIYKGQIPQGKKLTDYKNVKEFQTIAGMHPLEGVYSRNEDPSKAYRWEITEDNGQQHLVIEFQDSIPLEEQESVYAIIKTSPSKLPVYKRTWMDFTNEYATYNPSSGQWKEGTPVTLRVLARNKMFKQTQGAYTYDGKKWEKLTADGIQHDVKNLAVELIKEPGTYISWLVHVNWDGSMEGMAEIEDQLPEGVELTYVRYYWMAEHYKKSGQTSPEIIAIPELQGNQDWEERTMTYGSQTCISYYNPQTRKVKWNVDHLQAGGRDDRAIEFQVVCKVTDKNALLSGKEVSMKNSALVTYKGNQESDSDTITFKKDTLTKKSVYNKADGGNYSFKIELNPLGEDLVVGSETLTVIDELSNTLTIAPETIRIENQETGEDVTSSCIIQRKTSNEKQILRITVPDSMKLKITYKTYVNAKPGQTIQISNLARWEGYTVPQNGSVNEVFSYSVGGSAGGEQNPSLKIIKLDKDNVVQQLGGAVFSVQEMSKSPDGSWKPEGPIYKETTNDHGIAMFSVGTQEKRWMKFDTIYCLKEEEAPKGYVKNEEPHYFAILKDKTVEELSSGFKGDIQAWYLSAQCVYSAYNQKGEIKIEKTFHEADGTTTSTSPKGSYEFGLFKDEKAEGKPLQTLTITYHKDGVTYQRNGEKVEEPTFTKLEVNPEVHYYVFELDSQGQPVKEGKLATINGKTFEVTYSENGIVLDQTTQGKGTIRVKNTTKQFVLPETGGKGRGCYLILGAILLGITSFGYFYQTKKSRRIKN